MTSCDLTFLYVSLTPVQSSGAATLRREPVLQVLEPAELGALADRLRHQLDKSREVTYKLTAKMAANVLEALQCSKLSAAQHKPRSTAVAAHSLMCRADGQQ